MQQQCSYKQAQLTYCSPVLEQGDTKLKVQIPLNALTIKLVGKSGFLISVVLNMSKPE